MFSNLGLFKFSKRRKKEKESTLDIEQSGPISESENHQSCVSRRSRLEIFLITAVTILVMIIISLFISFYVFNLDTETVSASVKCDKDVSGMDLTEGSIDYSTLKATYEKEIFAKMSKKITGLKRIKIKEIRSGSLIIRFDVIVDAIENRNSANTVGEALGDMEDTGITVDGENVPVVSHTIGQDDYNHSCQIPIPGADIMKHGVDWRYFNLEFNPSQGRRRPVFKMKCNQRKKLYKGKFYEVPYNLEDPTPTGYGSFSEEAKIITKRSDVENIMKKSVSTEAGTGITLPKFGGLLDAGVSGSFSGEVNEMHREMEEHRSKYFEMSIKEYTMELEYKSAESLDLHDEFENFKLPENYKADPMPYRMFIYTFGTHYVKKSKLGGRIVQYSQVSEDFYNKHTSKELKMAATMSFRVKALGIISGEGSFSANQDKKASATYSEYQSSKKSLFKYIGGSANFAGDSYQTWQPTVAGKPEMVEVKLSPIFDLFKDKNIKEQMTLAVIDYLTKRGQGFLQTDTIYGKDCTYDYHCDPEYDGFKQFQEDFLGFKKNPQVCVNGRCQCRMNMMWAFSEGKCVFECATNKLSDAFVKIPLCGMIQKNAGPQTWMSQVTIEECAEKCVKHDQFVCKGFTFRSHTKDCQIHPYGVPLNKYYNVLNNGTCVYDFESLFDLSKEQFIDRTEDKWITDNRDFYQRQCYEGADMTQYTRDQTDAERKLHPDRKEPSRYTPVIDAYASYGDKFGEEHENWKLVPGAHPWSCIWHHSYVSYYMPNNTWHRPTLPVLPYHVWSKLPASMKSPYQQRMYELFKWMNVFKRQCDTK